MNHPNIVLVLVATVLLLTTGCPKQPDKAKETSAVTPPTSDQKQAPEAKDEAPAAASPETLIKQTLNGMVDGLNTKDLDLFTSCFHPESGELEEMLGFFEGFDNTKQKVEYLSLSVEAIEGEKALVEYTLGISDLEDDSKSEEESGEFEMLLHDGNWVIIDLS